ncbi:MAG: riboflavin biosynthesis protein RibF [Clostridia bacterium]|nr:riboflavin biosynthesis protein RibF [Clostridia bacterium]
MKVSPFNQKTTNPVVMCLGAFDSVHIGHKSLIKKAQELKAKYLADLCVFTFNNDHSVFASKFLGEVFTFEERLVRLENMVVDEVCEAKMSPEFASLSPKEFLTQLIDNRHIRAFVCGKDFKFGKNAKGNVELLKEFCNKKNIDLFVCDFVTDNLGNKIATTTIKEHLVNGEIISANNLLGDKYFISGKVVEGRRVGRTLGFPTANIEFSPTKLRPKSGVYLTEVIIDNKKYGAITNVGSAPTFNQENCLIETHIKNFSGDLYEKKLTVYFCDYIRPIMKFSTKEELINQLNEDLKVIK